ncbi:alpha-hydroxy acid oxidase [Gracilibacillus sp. YIM 98692]|uniref:alpha-hydroxy acid oxidase n=1 Tax=Gracilibacillus sp. YIM 98692 TaxID=2663532 RepID=UPI0013D1BFB2|nr:alpha-hydroxy acid oxidase [Gracilibacillus sp. YIM 98692]
MTLIKNESIVKEYGEKAEEKLDAALLDYIDSGSSPSVRVEQSTTKQNVLSEIILSPLGAQNYFHEDGELATAHAAKQLSTPFIVSSNSSYSIEEIKDAVPGAPLWFLAHVLQDHELTKHFVQRAELAGYEAIVIPTSNQPVLDYTDYLEKGDANFVVDPIFFNKTFQHSRTVMQKSIETQYSKKQICWDDIAYIQQFTNLPIYLYGDVTDEDARIALRYGVHGFILTGFSPFDTSKLSSLRTVVGKQSPIIVETEIETHHELQHLLHLGASSVAIKKAYVYSLIANGSKGIQHLLQQLNG